MPLIKYRLIKIILVLICCALYGLSHAADTTWLNREWATAPKEHAVYFVITHKEGPSWHQQLFYARGNGIYMNGYYLDSTCFKKDGNFRWYDIDGHLTDSVIYQKGIPLYRCWFHQNGQKKTVLIRDSNNIATYVNSWDQYGNESSLDTFYHDSKGQDCHKDTAFSKGIINREEDSVWRLRFYYVSNGSLYTVGHFKERLCKTRVRYGTWYQQGLLRDSILYTDSGKKREAWYYHDNGVKNAWQSFDKNGKLALAKNWDEQGNEIKADTSYIHALPLEGYKSWEKNMMKKMNNDNSIDWKHRKDLYSSVFINFFVNEDGTLQSAGIREPSLYPEMDSLILKACRETTHWKPCTAHGRRRSCARVKCFSYIAGIVIKAKDMYY